MKKLKKLVPFLTALTLLFSSAACGGGTDSAGGSSSSSFQESSSSSGSSAEETDEGQKAVNEALAELSAEDFTYAQLMGTDSLGRKTMPDDERIFITVDALVPSEPAAVVFAVAVIIPP